MPGGLSDGPVRRRSRLSRARSALLLAGLIAGWAAAAPAAPDTPAIRTGAANPVPACVTPERLMAFLTARNSGLDPGYSDIAAWYKRHGEALQVRWDYAFFQMLIETNYLTFQRGNGRRGDVDPRQYNFAGLGTTGGGVPGNSFPDVATGVRAQLEHLVVYSGERVAAPVAARTRLKQDDILAWTAPLSRKRAVTFQDLAGKWAVDRAYGRSIELTAERFRALHCTGQVAESTTGALQAGAAGPPALAAWQTSTAALGPRAAIVPPRPAPAVRAKVPELPKEAEPTTCRVLMASYGGTKTMLIRHLAADAVEYTALRVLDGFERSMTESYLKAHAPGGTLIGEFASSKDAFARAYQLCPGAERG
ncbi:MAG: glucosaminidase domain-containing protein [Hyphomicrobiaceae bacterium]|nr:glucosaminidase domain-containing protein [Hyphomicrobiaceae bacterium]